jgi:hypothetical protein
MCNERALIHKTSPLISSTVKLYWFPIDNVDNVHLAPFVPAIKEMCPKQFETTSEETFSPSTIIFFSLTFPLFVFLGHKWRLLMPRERCAREFRQAMRGGMKKQISQLTWCFCTIILITEGWFE